MRPPILDPTAGETARAARAHPEAAQRVLDPTDPRFGRVPTAGDPAGEVPRMFDPTDPDCDRASHMYSVKNPQQNSYSASARSAGKHAARLRRLQ